MPEGNDKKFIGNTLRESASRGYQQGKTRLGDKIVRAEAKAGNKKTAEKRDTFSGDIRIRDKRQPENQEQLQKLKNRDWKTFRDHKHWGENHVNSHRRRP